MSSVVDRAALAALLARRDVAGPTAGQVPFTTRSTRLLDVRPAGDGLDVRAEVTYRLPGDTRDVVRPRRLTVRAGPDGPRVVADRPDGPPRDLWDLGPVQVVRSGRAVVLAAAQVPPAGARAAAATVDAAARGVDAAWGADWRRDVVVLLPASDADAARLAAAPVAGLAALTTGTVEEASPGVTPGRRGGDERVVIVPTGWQALTGPGRRLVAAHELGHVAARSGARFAVPLWFEEGLAERVAHEAAGLDPLDVLADALTAVTPADLRRLPAAGDFAPSGPDPDRPYLLSWLACRALAGDGGTARLVAVHRIASGREPPVPGGPPVADAGAAWSAALASAGLDERGLVTLWRREVARAARITP